MTLTWPESSKLIQSDPNCRLLRCQGNAGPWPYCNGAVCWSFTWVKGLQGLLVQRHGLLVGQVRCFCRCCRRLCRCSKWKGSQGRKQWKVHARGDACSEPFQSVSCPAIVTVTCMGCICWSHYNFHLLFCYLVAHVHTLALLFGHCVCDTGRDDFSDSLVESRLTRLTRLTEPSVCFIIFHHFSRLPVLRRNFPSLRPMKLCNFWVQSPEMCQRGESCTFAHGVAELHLEASDITPWGHAACYTVRYTLQWWHRIATIGITLLHCDVLWLPLTCYTIATTGFMVCPCICWFGHRVTVLGTADRPAKDALRCGNDWDSNITWEPFLAELRSCVKAHVSKVTDLTLTQLRNPQALAMNEGVSRFLHTGFTPRVSLQHFKDVVITLIYSGTIYI